MTLYAREEQKTNCQLTSSFRNTVEKHIHKFILEHLTYDVINEMSDDDLDLLFGYTEPAVKDERFEQLESLLPDMEKQMKRKGAITLLWEVFYKQKFTFQSIAPSKFLILLPFFVDIESLHMTHLELDNRGLKVICEKRNSLSGFLMKVNMYIHKIKK
jgi:hypothetical protein